MGNREQTSDILMHMQYLFRPKIFFSYIIMVALYGEELMLCRNIF